MSLRFLISMQWGQKLKLCIGRWHHGNWHSCISRLSSKSMQCCRQHFWSILIIQCIGVLSWFQPNQQLIYIISISAFKYIKLSSRKSNWDKRTLMPKTSMFWKSIWINLKYNFEFWNLKIWLKSVYFFHRVWKFISNMDPAKWCHVHVFKFIMW